MKECTKCGKEKPHNEFYRNKQAKTGYHSWCKVCVKNDIHNHYMSNPKVKLERKKAWELSNPEKKALLARKVHLKREYGMTIAEYEAMEVAQGMVCAICGQPETKANNGHLSVDHCHETGKVRALLCNNCNTTLGRMQESPELLRKAADYLEGYAFLINGRIELY